MKKGIAVGIGVVLIAALLIFAAYPAAAQNTARSLKEEIGMNGFNMGVFGERYVKIEENVSVSSYSCDSSITCTVTVGSNLNVETDNTSTVDGNIAVGAPEPADDPINGTVTGEIQYDEPEWELPPIDMPAWYTLGGGGPEGEILGTVGSKPGQYQIDGVTKTFTAYQNAEVTFTPGMYHFEHFELQQNVKFYVGVGSEEIVEIYIGSSINFEYNTGFLLPIEVVGDATRLRVWYNGTSTADLSNNVHFTGFLYAPNATILARQNQYLYGALVGKAIDLEQNSGVHFDCCLMSALDDLLKPQPERKIWEEKVLTN